MGLLLFQDTDAILVLTNIILCYVHARVVVSSFHSGGIVLDLLVVQGAHRHVANTEHVVIPLTVLVLETLLDLGLDGVVFVNVVFRIIPQVFALLQRGLPSHIVFCIHFRLLNIAAW